MNCLKVKTKIGTLWVSYECGKILSLSKTKPQCSFSIETQDPSLEKNIELKIQKYLLGNEDLKSLPIKFEKGTDFQIKVWKEIYKIPIGRTVTYQQLATRMGRPKAFRAVASACGANPIGLIVPCHRVVAKKGLGGFFWGLNLKKQLLNIEKNFIESRQKSNNFNFSQ